MSNPCFTTYMVTGRREDIGHLHQMLEDMRSGKLYFVNGYVVKDKMWLGYLVKALGGDPKNVPCRGYVTYYAINGDDVLSIETQTAWCEYPELRHFIESRFEGMKIFYLEESTEDDLLNTNDSEGRFFKYNVFIDSDDRLGEYNDGYFHTLNEAAVAVSSIVGYHVEPCADAIESALDDYMESNPCTYFSYHMLSRE